MALAKALLAVVVVLAALPASAEAPDNLFKADQFRGSVPSLPMRGIGSGGAPWVLTSIEAKVDAPLAGETMAQLKVEVIGLVFAAGTIIGGVDVGGTRGGVAQFAATLSCVDEAGQTVNVTTGGFPTTTTGDAKIKERIALPPVCYSPLVFVRSFNPTTGVAGNWFAVNGF